MSKEIKPYLKIVNPGPQPIAKHTKIYLVVGEQEIDISSLIRAIKFESEALGINQVELTFVAFLHQIEVIGQITESSKATLDEIITAFQQLKAKANE